MLMHVLCENNRDIFVNVIPLRLKALVLTLNKIYVILKYILMKTLELYSCMLTMDVFA